VVARVWSSVTAGRTADQNFDLEINLKAAHALGMALPESVLARANGN
jgi:ABC-type uncharacterized transport system substrate-binding protein